MESLCKLREGLSFPYEQHFVNKTIKFTASPSSQHQHCTDEASVCGIVDNPFSVLFAVNVVIGPSPAHSLADAAIVIKLAIWPEIVRGPGTHLLLFLLTLMLMLRGCLIPLLL